MQREHYLRDVEGRIMHVVQHLQELHRELTCLVDEGVEDPSTERIVAELPEMHAVRALQLAMDHIRYFLYCLIEFGPDQDDLIDTSRPQTKALPGNLEFLSDAELLSLFCDQKSRKPN